MKFVTYRCDDCEMVMPFYDTEEGRARGEEWAEGHREAVDPFSGQHHTVVGPREETR